MKTTLTILTLVLLSFIATLIYVSENRNNCEELINKKLLNREYSDLIERKKNKLPGSKTCSNKKRQEEDDKTEDDIDSLINSLARKLESIRSDSKLSRKIYDELDKTDQVPFICHCKPDINNYLPLYDDNNCIDHTYDYSCDDFFESQKKSVDISPKGEWIPPDGGWGWLVLLAAVMVNVLIPGTIKSFGVLFVEFLNVFESGSAMAAWIPALCYFLYSSLGPLSSILSVRYSYRTVTLIGGTFAAVGMMLSFFADSIVFLCVSYGVFLGIGAGLAFPPTVYIVTSYFLRLRGFANGLCISGSALGSIFLPPVLNYLLQEFGYRGAVLIMGGVLLHVWAAALLYEPVEKHMKFLPSPVEKLTDEQVAEEEEEEETEETNQLNDNENCKNSLLIIPTIKTEKPPAVNNTNNSLSPKPKAVPKSASSVALENYKNTPVQNRTRKISMPTNREITSQMHSTPALHAVPERSSSTVRRKSTLRSPSISSFNYISTPYHGSTLSALQPEYASNLTLNAISSTFRKSPEKTIKPSNNANKSTDNAKTKFFDLTLLKDPIYLVILISNSTNAVSYTNFIILLPVYAISLGYDRNRAIALLSLNSAFDLIGRIGGSALSDTKIMPKHWYFVGGLLVSGVALTLMPTSTSYTMLASYCSIFGLASGIYVGVTAVIMADMLGTEKLTSSYGISLFVNGIIQLVGPPICGTIFEHIGSYGPIFSSLGIVLIAGASLWGCVPFIRRRQKAENLKAQASKV